MNFRMQESLNNPKKRKLLKRRKVTFSTDVNVVDYAECTGDASDSVTTFPQEQHLPSDTWYSPEELEEFKNSIKNQAKRYRVLSNKAVSSAATESSLVLPFHNCGMYKKMKYIVKVQNKLNKDPSNNHNDSSPKTSTKPSPDFRGLEHRIFFERQRNKTIAMNTVLEFQRRCVLLIQEAKVNQRSDTEIHDMKQQFAKRLSTIYAQLSQWAKDEASAAAHYDACGVYSIPNNECRKNENNANAMEKLAKNSKRKAPMVSDDDASSSSSASCKDQPRQYKRTRMTVD